MDDLNEFAGRDCVLDGLCWFLGVCCRSERERHEDGQATLLQERRRVATDGSVHWRALPEHLWMWMDCICRASIVDTPFSGPPTCRHSRLSHPHQRLSTEVTIGHDHSR